MSRLSTRTKIAVGVGLIVGVLAWLLLRPGPPPVTASFVAYAGSTNLVIDIQVSNRTAVAVLMYAGFAWEGRFFYGAIEDETTMTSPGKALLPPHSSRLLRYDFGNPLELPHRVQIEGYNWSGFRTWMRNHNYHGLVRKFGIDLLHPDFTVSIDLPPRSP